MGGPTLAEGMGTGGYVWATWLFLRALGLTYLIAFISYAVQVKGLIGHNGILPAREFVEAQEKRLGRGRFWVLPTLCWFSQRDRFLQWLCWGGALVSIAQFIGLAQPIVLVLLWVFYLSLFNVSRVFLGYQWDVLLLEIGFLAIFAAPLELLPHWPSAHELHWSIRWLLWLLLFRLMFLSGFVKLRSGDHSWRDLTALTFHYETQPLPTRAAWYIQQLPVWFHKLSTLVMYAIELALPFAIFIPGSYCRPIASLAFIGFMILIMITGNYGFFNLATIALCLLLFDDSIFVRFFGAATPQPDSLPAILPSVGVVVLILLLLLSANLLFRITGINHRCLNPLTKFCGWFDRFRILNSYGLFSVMTPKRLEILIEGSDDGREWRLYHFRYKPGDLDQPPRRVAPHQPRLDWQMWFAAFSDYRYNPWFIALMIRLLEGRPEVLALLEENPFTARPPRFIRAVLYEFHFTDWATRRRTGYWWRREKKWFYCPVLSLKGEERQLMAADELNGPEGTEGT